MYLAKENRYEKMKYNRCGRSGLLLPAVSMGLWQNCGYQNPLSNTEEMCRTAFDLGITHFDLANNYGNPYNGSAEECFGEILKRGMIEYRDEMIISTKAGYEMWPGPYGGKNGSKKYLVASLDQSLKRMGIPYVDIFYHHVPDPGETPLEETAEALDLLVRQGKALYVGISNYNKDLTEKMHRIFKELRTPFVINQPSYSMLNRWIEDDGLYTYAKDEGIGLAVFSPLYQGLLTDRYLNGVPADSRIGMGKTWIANELTEKRVEQLRKLNAIALERGQSLAQMALAWVLRNGMVTTVLAGASRPSQIAQNAAVVDNMDFSTEELALIEAVLKGE